MTRHQQDKKHGRSPPNKMSLKNVSALIAAVIAILAVLGYVYSFGKSINLIESELDRNCRFLAIVEADTRYLIIEHTRGNAQANAFREIFRNGIHDSCG